ncbi:MAG TPA: TonB-dependent receptor [Terriglobales bacterium]|nr:TonB-dependent receptor [Terriglobales bacterium]
MSRAWIFCCTCCLLLFLSVSAVAQSSATAELHVTVRDSKGAVVRNATVAVRNEARNIERSTSQNVDGEYSLLLLPPGQYTVQIEAPGFAKTILTNVVITVGQKAELPVTLQVAVASEVVNVSGEPELIEPQVTSSNTTVDQVRIDNLPINGRNYINFALTDSKLTRDAAPSIGAAPTSGLNFSGQRARSNLVNVDGANAVDAGVNGIRSTVSQDAVQEFQIITNNYNAEYGQASGGVVNIITRSGTNATHGSVYGYLRNRHIQGVNHFSTTPDPAYTRVQAGATFSGPIKKDRTFYFLSYETTQRHETGFSTIGADGFGLVPFDTSVLGPQFPFGIVQLTPDQESFVGQLGAVLGNPAIPPATKQQLGQFLGKYLVLAGGSSGIALNSSVGSPAIAAAIASSFGTPFNLSVFPTSGAPLPASMVALNSIVGNFPVSEDTHIASLRLDHRLTDNQQLNFRLGYSPSHVSGIEVNAQGPQNFGQNAFSRTSIQDFHDWSVVAQHTWTIGSNKVNEFRFQWARRALTYNFSSSPGGSSVAVNIPGFAFFGREPFSFVRRTEPRYQFTDNFSLTRGNHNFKWGADVNSLLPLEADFTVNFGGVYNIGALSPGQVLIDPTTGAPITSLPVPGGGSIPVPGFSPVQAYGLGIPQAFIQGVGNPHDSFNDTNLGVFFQDSWRIRPNLTINYGVRYDVEFTPTFKAINQLSQAAENALGITEGIPRDYNNVVPRVGVAWDPWKEGKTLLRASYGLFYDHPLLALAFDSDVADGAQAPQVLLFGGSPGGCTPNLSNLNATNAFQGLLACLPGSFNYLASQQRFNAAPNAPSIFVGQQYLATGVPLTVQPFGFPTGKNFVFGYSNQASFGLQQDLGHDMVVDISYTFNGGRHLNRPINFNATQTQPLVTNYNRAVAAVNALKAGGVPANVINQLTPSSPLSVGICPTLLQALGLPPVAPAGNYVPAPLVSFFRQSGFNPSLQTVPPYAACNGDAQKALTEFGLGVGVPVPFSDEPANYSNGTSDYHGLTVNLRKRFSAKYEFLASYTWSHAIDDGTDLQSPLEPQDNFNANADRSTSTFDQRHRLVFSGVYQSGRVSSSGFLKVFNDITVAPIIEVGSGRPFNIITSVDANFDLSVNTDRPNVVPAGTTVDSCGDPVVASKFSPTGFFQIPCYLDGKFTGNLGRNTGVKPWTVFNDLRLAKRMRITERLSLDGIMDIFNLINRYNIADVNPLYTNAGEPTAAYDPRQFQFALKLSW